jgi:hypothetical protein
MDVCSKICLIARSLTFGLYSCELVGGAVDCTSTPRGEENCVSFEREVGCAYVEV